MLVEHSMPGALQEMMNGIWLRSWHLGIGMGNGGGDVAFTISEKAIGVSQSLLAAGVDGRSVPLASPFTLRFGLCFGIGSNLVEYAVEHVEIDLINGYEIFGTLSHVAVRVMVRVFGDVGEAFVDVVNSELVAEFVPNLGRCGICVLTTNVAQGVAQKPRLTTKGGGSI